MITLIKPKICYNLKDYTFDKKVFQKFFQEMSYRFYSEKLINIIYKMILINPKDRVDFEQLKQLF